MLEFIIIVAIIDAIILYFVPGEKIQKVQNWIHAQVDKIKNKVS